MATFFLYCCCPDVAGKLKDESTYLFNTVKGFAVKDNKGRTKFRYHVGAVHVCRTAFCVTLGLAPDSSHIKKFETLVRQGHDEYTAAHRDNNLNDKTKESYVRSFLMTYMMVHSEKDPVKQMVLLEPTNLTELFEEYKSYFRGVNLCAYSTFRKLWYQQLRLPLPDPVSDVIYAVKMRRRAKAGFKRCDECCALQFQVYSATGQVEKLEARDNYDKHLQSIKLDREGLNRIRALCNGRTIVGFSIDAADRNKFFTPSVKCRAHLLSGMYTIKNKITGVEFFSGHRKLLLFRSLPHLSTGANLTLTIIARAFNLGYFDEAKEVYINWDGSHDNVNYTCVYSLIHFLLCAESAGWALRKFTIIRLQVGHTHILLDAVWSQLSQLLYGTHSRGDARRDMLCFDALEKLCKTALKKRLTHFEYLRGCFNFDTFVEGYRPQAADTTASKCGTKG